MAGDMSVSIIWQKELDFSIITRFLVVTRFTVRILKENISEKVSLEHQLRSILAAEKVEY